MHDNDNVGFIDTGFAITSLPNPYTQFNFLDCKLAQSSPYMKFKYNTDSLTDQDYYCKRYIS